MLHYKHPDRLALTCCLQEFARRKALEGDDTLQEALLAHPLPANGNRIIIEPPSTTQEEEYEGIEPEVGHLQ